MIKQINTELASILYFVCELVFSEPFLNEVSILKFSCDLAKSSANTLTQNYFGYGIRSDVCLECEGVGYTMPEAWFEAQLDTAGLDFINSWSMAESFAARDFLSYIAVVLNTFSRSTYFTQFSAA
jgi:hypothetical protein